MPHILYLMYGAVPSKALVSLGNFFLSILLSLPLNLSKDHIDFGSPLPQISQLSNRRACKHFCRI